MRGTVRFVAEIVADGAAGILQETQKNLVGVPGGVAVAAVDPFFEPQQRLCFRAGLTQDKEVEKDRLPLRHVLTAYVMVAVVAEFEDASEVELQVRGQFRLQGVELFKIGTREHEVDVVVPGDEAVVPHCTKKRPEGEHVLDLVSFAEIVEFEKKVFQLFVIALTLVVGEFKLHG